MLMFLDFLNLFLGCVKKKSFSLLNGFVEFTQWFFYLLEIGLGCLVYINMAKSGVFCRFYTFCLLEIGLGISWRTLGELLKIFLGFYYMLTHRFYAKWLVLYAETSFFLICKWFLGISKRYSF